MQSISININNNKKLLEYNKKNLKTTKLFNNNNNKIKDNKKYLKYNKNK